MRSQTELSRNPTHPEAISPPTERLADETRLRQGLTIGGVLLFFALLLVLLLALSMGRELNHDEHQFVASAAQIVRQGQLPYVDFVYFHVPLLSFVYAALFQLTDRLLLSARLVSVCCAWLTLWLIFVAAYRSFPGERRFMRLLLSGAAALWLMATPLFTYASGRAWNHDLPIFLMVLAFLIQSHVLIEARSPLWLTVGGALMGLAMTTRLSFAFAAIPFALAFWLYPGWTGRRRWAGLSAFSGGALAAGIPMLYLFARDPAAFFFGNVAYVQLNALYFEASGVRKGMTLANKFSHLARMFITEPGNLLLMAALLEGIWPLRNQLTERLPFVRRYRTSRQEQGFRSPEVGQARKKPALYGLAFLLLILFFVTVSGFGATPFQPQYFFVMAPVMVLSVLYALSAWPISIQPQGKTAFLIVTAVTVALAIPAYAPGLAMIAQPEKWEPNRVHGYGLEIAARVPAGEIATLAPIYALEGNGSLPGEFVTGPFAWRVAPLVSAAERIRYGLVGPDELAARWAEQPPAAILVGVEEDDAEDEEALLAYAQALGYTPFTLSDGSTLWVRTAEE